VLGHEGAVARGLDVLRDPLDGVVPGDVLPAVGPWTANLGPGQPVRVRDVVLEGHALRTQRAAVDGAVRISFDVHHRRRHVLRLVAERVDDDAAGDGAIGTDAARLGRARDLELPHLGARARHVEADADGSAAERSTLEERPPLHGASEPLPGGSGTAFGWR